MYKKFPSFKFLWEAVMRNNICDVFNKIGESLAYSIPVSDPPPALLRHNAFHAVSSSLLLLRWKEEEEEGVMWSHIDEGSLCPGIRSVCYKEGRGAFLHSREGEENTCLRTTITTKKGGLFF